MKLRVRISKEGGVRFISHLEYSRTISRAVKRAKLPVAYSEGFNPHIKMSLASALGVGIESVAEYAEFDLALPVEKDAAMAALNASLPPGIRVLGADVVDKSPPLMSQLTGADYEVTAVCRPEEVKAWLAAVEFYNSATDMVFAKKTPPGKPKREVDLKGFVAKIDAVVDEKGLILFFYAVITPQGTVKAQDVLAVLTEKFGAPLDKSNVAIKRLELYGAGKEPLLSGGRP